MGIKPIFIFSLPRAGSTLAQRILATDPRVATSAEPWLLLPQLYALREEGSFSEYKHVYMTRAIHDFIQMLPGKKADYDAELKAFICNLYAKAAGPKAEYFLDKTPRYHLVAQEIMDLFPDGKFIFLWRNPLAVAASITSTFGKGRWRMHDYRVDLYDGLKNLVSVWQDNAHRAISIRFEDMLIDPSNTWGTVFKYLGLDFDQDCLTAFSDVDLEGRMGDPTGVKEFRKVSTKPLVRWTSTMSNPLRRRWCHAYLRQLGEDRLSVMGYSREELLAQLGDAPVSYARLADDAWRYPFGWAVTWFDLRILKYKLRKVRSGNIHAFG